MPLTSQFAKWLRTQLAHLDELEADPRDTLASCETLADVISETGRRAAAAGLLDEGIYVIGFFYPVVAKGQALEHGQHFPRVIVVHAFILQEPRSIVTSRA